MKITSTHIGLGIGALLLFGRNKKAVVGPIDEDLPATKGKKKSAAKIFAEEKARDKEKNDAYAQWEAAHWNELHPENKR